MAGGGPGATERGGALVVRDATPADADTLGELHVTTWRHAYRELLDAGYLAGISADEQARTWRERLEIPPGLDHFTLVAVDARRALAPVLGFATGGGSRDADRKGYGEIYALYVSPERWRSGVGRALITTGRRRLEAGGFTGANLWVLEGNAAARAFYERLGWCPDGTRREITLGPSTLIELRHRFAR